MKQAVALLVTASAVGLGLWATLKSGGGGSLSGARRRRSRGLGGPAEARELKLFCENDGDLYRQQVQPIEKNLKRKLDKGVYDHEKAKKLWMHLAESCAKKYAKEFGSEFIADRPGVPWHKMFSTADRREVAKAFADSWWSENRA